MTLVFVSCNLNVIHCKDRAGVGGTLLLPVFQYYIMTTFYDAFGRSRKLEDLNAVESIFKLKGSSGSSPWPAIAKLIEIWTSKHPKEWKSYLVYLQEQKDTRKVTYVGASRFRGLSRDDREHDAITRYTVDIPQPIIYGIRFIYSDQELPMDEEFFAEFARKFPTFRVMEKIA